MSPAEIEALVLELESVTVAAAFDAASPTAVSADPVPARP
jgi:hypothetical protein